MRHTPTMLIHYGADLNQYRITTEDAAAIGRKLEYALPGWTFVHATNQFHGPARDDAYLCIEHILTEWFGPAEPPAPLALPIDVTRGRPSIDSTMGRGTCKTHGDNVAQSYIGRERYACWHCANETYDRLTAE